MSRSKNKVMKAGFCDIPTMKCQEEKTPEIDTGGGGGNIAGECVES